MITKMKTCGIITYLVGLANFRLIEDCMNAPIG